MTIETPAILAIHRAICEDSIKECLEDYGSCVKAAEAIQPRTINTAQELGGLPLGSVVLDSANVTRTYVATPDGDCYYADCYGDDGVLDLPATLLHDGSAA